MNRPPGDAAKVGERILGLPREPGPSRGLPFRRVQAGGT